MKVRSQFRAAAKVKLDDADASATPLRTKDGGKAKEREQTAALIAQIGVLQEMLYAERRQKVLVVLQGMDTSGKDGTVKALFEGINPAGLQVVSFRAPSADEMAHDYLWRVHRQVPAAGEITVFNRSHYEDVLVPLVLDQIDAATCKRRYAHMRDFERMLAETGTVIVKVFLHLSSAEQRVRLQERLDDPNKQWKFDPNDIVQRHHWDAYQRAYEKAIVATDCDPAPWYIVPADSKTHRNLIIAHLLLETMQAMDLHYPAPDPALSTMKII